jgi:hypothetical protein
MPIPVYTSQERAQTYNYTPSGAAPVRTSGLTGALAGIAASMSRDKQEKLKKAEALDSALWLESATTDLARAQIEYQANTPPSETAIEDWEKFYQKKKNELVATAGNEEEAVRFQQATSEVEISGYTHATNLVFAKKKMNTQDRLNKEVSVVADMYGTLPTPDEYSVEALFEQKDRLKQLVEERKGILLNDEDVAAYDEKINKLLVGVVDMWSIDNPDMSKKVLDRITGIDSRERRMYEDRIRSSRESKQTVDRAAFSREQTDALASVRETGESGNFDIVRAASKAYPTNEKQRQEAIHQFNTSKKVNEQYFHFTKAIKGASPAKVTELIEKHKPSTPAPDEGAPPSLEWRLYGEVQTAANNYLSQLNKDPYSTALMAPKIQASPEYKAYVEAEEQINELLRKGEPIPEELTQDYTKMVDMAEQIQGSWGFTSGEIRSASKSRLDAIASLFNNKTNTSQDIVNGVNSLRHLYGDKYPDVIRDIQAMPSNEGITPFYSLLIDQIDGDRTPQLVHSALDYVRAPRDKLGVEQTDLNDYRDRVEEVAAPLIQTLLNSGAPNARTDAIDILDGLAKVYAGRVGTEGLSDHFISDNLKKTVKALVMDNYFFDETNGRSYALPKDITISDWTDNGRPITKKDVTLISATLDAALDLPTRYQGAVEDYAYSSIGIDKLTGFLSTPDGAAINGYLGQPDAEGAADDIRENAYWAYDKNTGGMVLMMTTGEMQARPVYKGFKEVNGKTEFIPFTVSLEDIMDAGKQHREKLINQVTNIYF